MKHSEGYATAQADGNRWVVTLPDGYLSGTKLKLSKILCASVYCYNFDSLAKAQANMEHIAKCWNAMQDLSK